MIFNPRSREKKKDLSSRIWLLGMFFLILAILIILRLGQLQIINYQKYQTQAESLRTFEKQQEPERGEIFVEDGSKKMPVAMNIYSYILYAVPRNISDPQKTAEKIALAFDISTDPNNEEFKKILDKVSIADSWYEIIKKDLTQIEADKIDNLSIEGIGFEKEVKRFYPEKDYFAHLLGFFGYKGDKKVGRYGIEEYYENILSGKEGLTIGEKAAGDLIIPTAKNISQNAQNGSDLVLTIDRTIQTESCKILNDAATKNNASGGTIIVVDPKRGAILSLCNWPSFDPNEYAKVTNLNIFSNKAIASQYEPGSVLKALTMSMGIEDGKVLPETTYEDKGFIKIGGYTIKNAAEKVYGKKTMVDVIEKSINTGAVFVAQKVGLNSFRDWVQKFGLGEKTGIDLPGEIKGDIRNLYQPQEIYLATASFGQGIATTPLQILMSFASIANGGKLMKPYIVKEIISDKENFKIEPQEIRQVISSKTAEIIKDMLIRVVTGGWGTRAQVKGYLIAGKTGTAEVPYVHGYSNETVHSFVGFAPADDPEFVAIVKLDNPAQQFAESTAVPAFGQLADFLLKYYQIPPSEIK